MNRNNTLLEFDSHEFQNAMQKKGLSLRKIAKLTGIDRKTLYNAMLTGKVTYRTAKMLDAAHLARFDMVNVIRCKDCKWHQGKDCMAWDDGTVAVANEVEDEGYCYLAERKEKNGK